MNTEFLFEMKKALEMDSGDVFKTTGCECTNILLNCTLKNDFNGKFCYLYLTTIKN